MSKKSISQILSDIINDNQIETSDMLFDIALPKSKYYSVESYEVKTDEKSKELSRPIGKYILLTLQDNNYKSKKLISIYTNAIVGALSNVLPQINNNDTILVVGLGNEKIDSDSLGHNVCSMVIVTRLIGDMGGLPKTATIAPSVMGDTGIETCDIVCGIVEKIKPKCIIIVDSLCATSYKRLGCSIQITNAGLTPGEGVQSPKKPLNKSTLNCDVITIGVPLMIYAKAFCNHNTDIDDTLVVTFHDIDYVVKDIARIIAKSINKAVLGIDNTELL